MKRNLPITSSSSSSNGLISSDALSSSSSSSPDNRRSPNSINCKPATACCSSSTSPAARADTLAKEQSVRARSRLCCSLAATCNKAVAAESNSRQRTFSTQESSGVDFKKARTASRSESFYLQLKELERKNKILYCIVL